MSNNKVGKIGKDQNGFSSVKALLILVILGILGFTGWYVLHAKQNTDKLSTSSASAISSTAKTNSIASWKTYTNQDTQLTYKYPSNWSNSVTEMAPYDDGSFVGISGTITSPSKHVLYWVYQEAGGKGGDCTPAAGDMPFNTGDACHSKQVLSVEQIPSAKPNPNNVGGRNLFEDKLYITETKYQGDVDPATQRSAKNTIYQICLDPRSNDGNSNVGGTTAPQTGTTMGLLFPCDYWDTGFNVTFPVANQAGFNSADAKIAILIMKSFNSL